MLDDVPSLPRYGPAARCYDVLSGERAVYRAGREAGVAALGLRPGQTVLDLGCGTGLTLPLLVDAVGPTGAVLGVDASAAMLAQARVRVAEHRWTNVRLEQGVLGGAEPVVTEPADAAVLAYSLSIVDDWVLAWERVLARVRPGGRVLVLDTTWPTGSARLLSPLAWLAFTLGGVDPERRPWRLAERDLDDPRHQVLKGGHVHAVTGTRP